MANEAEYERLYQEFIRNGGGKYTFDASGRTPAEFYNISDTTLTPEQIAQLEAEQEQYNRQAALNVFADEIASNNFSNPYSTVADNGVAAYNALAADPGVIALSELDNAIGQVPDAALRNELADLIFFGGVTGSTIALGGYGSSQFNEQTVVGIPGTPNVMIPIYDQVRDHTNGQVSNFPQTLQDVTSLVSMNKQFGDTASGSGCNLFNQLMGILSGVLDPAFDFMQGITNQIRNMLAPITNLINDIKNKVMDFVNGIISNVISAVESIIAPFKAAFDQAMSALNGIMGQMTSLIGNITNQLAGEIAGLLDLANNLLQKAQALVMAAAAFDVCQLAALLNVGSPNMASAINQLTTPLSSAMPTVPTETDPRANPDAVNAAMSAARQTAATSPGVPQSPFRALATLYQPMSSYLHSATRSISGILGDAFSSVSSALGSSGSQSINVPNISIPSVQSVLGSQSGANSNAVGARPSNQVTSIRSDAYHEFTRLYGSELLTVRNNLKTLRLDIAGKLTTLSNVDQQSRARVLIENLTNQENSITTLLNDSSNKLIYTVSGNINRDADKETAATQTFQSRIRDRSNRVLSRSNTMLNDVTNEWNQMLDQNGN